MLKFYPPKVERILKRQTENSPHTSLTLAKREAGSRERAQDGGERSGGHGPPYSLYISCVAAGPQGLVLPATLGPELEGHYYIFIITEN